MLSSTSFPDAWLVKDLLAAVEQKNDEREVEHRDLLLGVVSALSDPVEEPETDDELLRAPESLTFWRGYLDVKASVFMTRAVRKNVHRPSPRVSFKLPKKEMSDQLLVELLRADLLVQRVNPRSILPPALTDDERLRLRSHFTVAGEDHAFTVSDSLAWKLVWLVWPPGEPSLSRLADAVHRVRLWTPPRDSRSRLDLTPWIEEKKRGAE